MEPIAPPAAGDGEHVNILVEDTYKFCLLVYAQVHLWIKIVLHQHVAASENSRSFEMLQMIYHTSAIKKLRLRLEFLSLGFRISHMMVRSFQELAKTELIVKPAEGAVDAAQDR